MINLENLAKQQRLDNRISIIKQKLKIGDRVRCYESDKKSLNSFVGYAYITEIIDDELNFCWCESEFNEHVNGQINYSYYVVKSVL
jgi:hypothetical protein